MNINLKPLFEMQKVLDDRIINEKGLKGQYLVPNTILASLVELAECAQEWRGFKHWSNDQNPRIKVLRHPTMMEEDKEYYNPLLEEYVDKLHFILSLGNQFNFNEKIKNVEPEFELDLTGQFVAIFYTTSVLYYDKNVDRYSMVIKLLLGLGEMLGFTWEQIEKAYMEKNKINHQRQTTGY